MSNFNITKFGNSWYITARIPDFLEYNDKCSTAIRSNTKISNQYDLTLSAVSGITGKNHKLVVSATQKLNDPKSVFHARYPAWLPIDVAKLTVLDTDYDNYGIVVGVLPLIGKSSLMLLWVHSRRPILAPEYNERVMEVLRDNNIPTNILENVNQKDCK
ncbi:apolipoprotein D-like [Aphidius gifuensis]|nr:apolipoprotein D-like [Aphidius gifuensis]